MNSATIPRHVRRAGLSDPAAANGSGSAYREPDGSALRARPPTRAPLAKQPDWMPRMWTGCDLVAWFKLLRRHRFAIHVRYWWMVVPITLCAVTNTLLGLVERLVFGRAVRATKIVAPPIFLLGHWRSGTTLLHELMTCDARFGYPTTYQCFEPHHFLLTERLFSRLLWFLVPRTRPMDDMPMAFDRPQEDEFALCLLGAASPYATIAFPNEPGRDGARDLTAPAAADVAHWKRTFLGFVQRLTYRTGKRLVLKSPPHTGRIATLLDLFPDAIFIHIVRDPYVVFASTVNLWRTLYQTHGLQTPPCDGIEERVLDGFVHMHERLGHGRARLRPNQFHELAYEDLIADPEGEIAKIYDRFGLGGADTYLPKLRAYLAATAGYRTNTYTLTDAQHALVTARWGDIIRHYRCG